MADDRRKRLAQELTHTGSSSQHAEDIEFVELPREYGGGYAMRKKQELEAPFLDPLLPGFLGGLIPKSAPAKVATGTLRGLRGYGRLGAEGLHRFVNSGSPLATAVAPLSVIKNRGGNWLSGSVEGQMRGLKSEPHALANGHTVERIGNRFIEKDPDGKVFQVWETQNPAFDPYQLDHGEVALNHWIDKQLTRYIKNDMATPEDPIRELAEQGVLHTRIDPTAPSFSMKLGEAVRHRKEAGIADPTHITGKAPQAMAWDTIADAAVFPSKAGTWQQHMSGRLSPDLEADRGWMMKVSPETPVYALDDRYAGISPLGFDHLIDELSNSLNPNSGLPQHLLLDPKSLTRVSVPQAVERVHNINQWRAAQKAEADLLRANNAATVLHKEYPEKGMRWVELKAPADTEGLRRGKIRGREAFLDESGIEVVPGRQALQDALKYEGDTMGHCVGGYCDDVLEGRSRIFSLRDAKGQPHVTIEVSPEKQLPTELSVEEFDALPAWQRATYTEKPRIVQIKGKGNARPIDDYLPFVQDFVKSGQWSDVGDLHNTGLRRTIDMFNSNELRKIQEAGIEVPQWMTPEEQQAVYDKVWPNMAPKGYAEGGSVKSDNFDQWSDDDLRQFITSGQEPRTLQQNQQGQYVDPASEQKRAAAAEEQRKGDFMGAFQRSASAPVFGAARVLGLEGADEASKLLGKDIEQDRQTWKGSLGATLGAMLPAAAWPFAAGTTLGGVLTNAASGAALEGLSGYGEGHSATQALTQDAPRGAAGVALANIGANVVGKGINATRGKWSDPELKYVYDFAKSKGVDLRPGDIAPSSFARGFENLHVGAAGQGRLREQAQQLEKALFGDGNKLLQGFANAEVAIKDASKALWSPVNQIAAQGTTNVAPKSARVIIDDILGKYPNMLNKIDNVQLRDKLLAIAEAKSGKLPGLSFAEVRELQQAVGPELAKMKLQALNGTITKDEASAMARLYGSLHEDLKRWGQHGSNQKAYDAYQQANEVYKRDFLPFENNELITKWRAGKYDADNEALISDLLRPANRTQQGQLLWYLSQADHDATGYMKMLQAADRAGITLARGLPEQSVPLGIATLISPKTVAARATAGAASGSPRLTPFVGARPSLLPRRVSQAVRGGLGLSTQELLDSKED